ncbi:MAG: multidrug ABC transporter ATP-binding protein [Acidobacteria bacterium RIFCSPLOWO2_02_FULL_61_28]|nr:MAG: multidrug ABC transporter ATP-binding protein [Acidobacteria bacterium RIFCSPLOWO2_02_FULL_61_28]
MVSRVLGKLGPLFPYLRPYRRQYALGFASLVGEVAFWVAVPQIIRFAIDDIQEALTPEKLLFYSGLLLGAALGKAFFLFWTRMILIGISRDVEYDLRNALYRHLTVLSQSYFQRTRTGDIMSRAINDLNAVRMMLGPGIMYSARTLILLAAAVAILLQISPRLTFYSFALVPVIAVVVSYFGRRIHERFETIQAMMSTLSAKVQESLAGIRVIRAFAQEEADRKRFQELNEDFVARNRKLIRVWGMFYPALEVLMGLIAVIVLWAGGREVASGNISIGSFVAFNVYMGQLAWPMIALGWVVNLYQRGTASLARLNAILAEPPEIADRQEPARAVSGDAVLPESPVSEVPRVLQASSVAPSNTSSGDGRRSSREEIRGAAIEFRNVSFSYNGRAVLHDINLVIPAGSTLAMVGPTGSGKSTLVSLIPRLYDAPPGTLWLDQRDIREYRLDDLRRMIGFVPQETFLFSETIRENIAFGVEHSSEEDLRRAAEVAGLLPDIEDFPRGFETLVGERGITLSGGQKQRTAIARAILRDPRILILDDALSSVDTYTEEVILTRLQQVLRGRTAILISHRISTVRGADQIIVLAAGRIVERGTHQELLERGSYYPELYQKQLLEEELERA